MAVRSYNILGMFTLSNNNVIFTQIEHSMSVSSDSLYKLLKDVQDMFMYSTSHHEGVRSKQTVAIVRTYHCRIINAFFESAVSLSISDCSLAYWAVTFDDIVFVS
jgi:hypothetical protein